MLMVLFEAVILALVGVAAGLILGANRSMGSPVMDVVNLQPEQIPAAGELLARSLFEDGLARHMYPEDRERQADAQHVEARAVERRPDRRVGLVGADAQRLFERAAVQGRLVDGVGLIAVGGSIIKPTIAGTVTRTTQTSGAALTARPPRGSGGARRRRTGRSSRPRRQPQPAAPPVNRRRARGRQGAGWARRRSARPTPGAGRSPIGPDRRWPAGGRHARS